MPELKSLNLVHLVGNSSLLKPYMSGYFVNQKLYEQARLIANPFIWEEERAKRVREKIEKERASRIRGTKKVKVNQRLVDKLLKKQEKREQVDTEAGILGDSRFSKMFEDEEFAVDETSREFQILNPNTKVHTQDDAKHKGDPDSASGSDEEDSDRDIFRPTTKSPRDVDMRVSSSQIADRRSRDVAFGARAQKNRRGEKSRQDVVGERHVTFMPESRRKSQQSSNPTPAAKRSDPRRSASSNTLRRL